jgi:hypothetical protein
MSEEPLLTALRVLSSWTECKQPSQRDIDKLRQAAPCAEVDWAPDSLAIYIIERELHRERKNVLAGGPEW